MIGRYGIDVYVDDDGVQVEVYREGRKVAHGVALHRNKGPKETVGRAIADARAELARKRAQKEAGK